VSNRNYSIEKEFREKAPDGWMVLGDYVKDKKTLEFRERYGIAGYIERSAGWVSSRILKLTKSHPDWVGKFYLGQGGRMRLHYPPDLISELKKIAAAESKPPEGWMVIGVFDEGKKTVKNKKNSGICAFVGRGPLWLVSRIADLIKLHPDWSPKPYLDISNQSQLHYPPALIEELKKIAAAESKPPEGWMVIGGYGKDIKTGKMREDSGLSAQVKRGRNWVYAHITDLIKLHPEWASKPYLDSADNLSEHYPPALIEELKKIAAAESKPPEGWMLIGNFERDKITAKIKRNTGIAGQVQRSPNWVSNHISELIKIRVEFKSKLYLDEAERTAVYYPPALIEELKKIAAAESKPPEGWMVIGNLVKDQKVDKKKKSSGICGYLGRGRIWFLTRALGLIKFHPEWASKPYLDGTNKIGDFYPPDLIAELKKIVDAEKNGKADFEVEEKNKENVKKLVEEISEGQTETAQQFRSLVKLFGASHALDILYKFRPEFKGLPVEYVKSCLADYLGDFLAAKHNFVLKDVGAAAEFLSETTFRDGLYEVLKDHCLQYYYAQKRLGTHQDGFSIINAYLDHVVEEVGGISNKFLDDIIQKVLEFYDSALRDFKKPEQFVDRLSEDRDFPDINQRVNMKELAEKKKLLIADEMGLGKSASVIMAKEQLRIGCALVVAPSNVLDTWMAYLSDDESKKGYFRKGEAPRVLKVESPKQLEGISKTDYDYILISQERMVESYTRPLADLDPDMMIVDEVHKIKSLKGVRTKEFLPIAQKMQGDNKYLALLSGTPAPNKVRDVAIILKLLYPERFSDTPDADLVKNIIHGDIVDLRSLLIPKMQMKNLEDSVEMPELKQEIVNVQMSDLEKDVYEVLVEEDEFTATEKLKILRQFLLNPHLLDSTPGLESCKINALQAEVDRIFATKSKAVVFVNGYIENIIRGDMTIFDKLKLPDGVEIRKIEGKETNKRERNKIQEEFNEANGKKILLVVSGDTADVGVSFTGGEEVIFYNEPWTEASKRQQLARVYRPGLEHAVAVKTLIVKGTIEEGIHSYIQAKYKAVEKLLWGVPLTELEKSQLVNDEKSEDKSLEINREWAEYFFSSVEIMNKMFGAIKNIGEEMFRKFLEEYGARYAEAYRDLGSRSYQSNTNRVSGTLISEMMRKSKQDPGEVAILDVASGPEMLRRHIGDEFQDSVHSLDINQAHFDNTPGKKYVGSWIKTPFEDSSFDYLNLAMSLHYSEFVPSKGKLERLEVLREINRVLKEGGRVVISMIYSLKIKDLEKFAKFIEALGFRIVEDYSGTAESELAFRSQVLTLEKVKAVQKTAEEIMGEVGVKNSAGLKMETTKVKLKNQRKVLHAFLLNGKGKAIELNAADQRIVAEEKEITTQGESMKSAHGGEIKAIPVQEIVDKKFVRIVPKNKYILFKRLSSASGAVVIK